jgi:protein tyrosine phosphatase
MCDLIHKISHIHKNIYISDIYNACDINELKIHNIKAILHLGDFNKSQGVLQKYIDNCINNKFLEIRDTLKSDISECFEESYGFINFHVKQRNNILIHCKKGISRSPSIVAYYLLRKMYEHKIKKNEEKNTKSTHQHKLNIISQLSRSRSILKSNKTYEFPISRSILKINNKSQSFIEQHTDDEYMVFDILDLIQLGRPCVNPNRHFIDQLKKYEDINIQTLLNEG